MWHSWGRTGRHLIAFGLMALVAFLAYANTFSVPFQFDDRPNISENPNIQIKTLSLERLEQLKSFPFVGDVRGKGLMAAIEFVRDQKTKEPFPRAQKFTEKVIDLAFENGLVLYPGTGFVDGVNGDMVMLGPPLIIEEAQIDEIVDILRKTLAKLNP